MWTHKNIVYTYAYRLTSFSLIVLINSSYKQHETHFSTRPHLLLLLLFSSFAFFLFFFFFCFVCILSFVFFPPFPFVSLKPFVHTYYSTRFLSFSFIYPPKIHSFFLSLVLFFFFSFILNFLPKQWFFSCWFVFFLPNFFFLILPVHSFFQLLQFF